MAAGNLTDAKIKALKATGKRYKLADGDGLYLEVTETGSKAFRMRIQTGGKDSTITLGKYPYLSLAEARLKRNDLLRQIANGIDPRKENRQKKQEVSVPTFRQVAEEWMHKQESSWREAYAHEMQCRLESDAMPYIGAMPITEITARHVLDLLRNIESRGSYSTSEKMLRTIKQIFRYAVSTLIIDMDPVAGIDGNIVLTRYQTTHFAAATTKEDAAFVIRAVKAYTGTAIIKLALEFLMLTFVRPGNVLQAEWTEISMENKVWTIPAHKMKMGKEHKVPLSRQALEVLRQAKAWRHDNNDLIFPSPYRKKPGARISAASLWIALRVMGIDQDKMSAHGFRSMASSLLNEAGYYPDVIETQLAHTSGNIRAIYNRTEYWDDRVKLMQAWADMCDELGKIKKQDQPAG